jgi:hypothetical protein
MIETGRHILAISLGFIGGLIPNKKSNINHLLMGVIFALLFSKILVGDYDTGYQWTYSDILFVLIVGTEGFIGAWISQFTSL